mgnify:CR=1 FL=1|jgi:hypothetical protein
MLALNPDLTEDAVGARVLDELSVLRLMYFPRQCDIFEVHDSSRHHVGHVVEGFFAEYVSQFAKTWRKAIEALIDQTALS